MASRLQDVIQRSTRALQPLATDVAPGTLYYVTDELITERSSGTAWESYADGSGPTIVGGVYTPTLTNVANLAASTAFQCQYIRVSSVVTVSGKVSIDPTLTATSTILGISLPVASNIGAAEDCGGVAFASGIFGQGAAILGDAVNNRAQLQFISGDITNQPMYFTFTYRII